MRTTGWLLACALALLSPQALALSPQRPLSQFGHQAWANAQGLPQATVYAMAQGQDGYLWLGTEEGLVRFDGTRFVAFNRSNTPAIPSNRIRAVHVDAKGDVWFGTQTAGLVRLHEGVFELMGPSVGMTSKRIRVVASGRSGAVYVGADDALFRWDGSRFVKERELQTVLSLYEARDGTLWVGLDGALARLSPSGGWKLWTKQDGLPYSRVLALAEDDKGRILLGVRDGTVVRFDGTTFEKWLDGKMKKGARALLYDRDGALWIGTDGQGLMRLVDGKLEGRSREEGLTDIEVISLLEDREGNIYAGTMAGGLNQVREPKFSMFGPPEGLAHPTNWAVYEDRAGTIWLGTVVGLSRLENGVVQTESSPELVANVYAILEDHEGTLWVGGSDGISRRQRGGAWERVRELGGVTSLAVYSLHESPDQVLRIGTSTGVLTRKGGEWSFQRTDPVGPMINQVRDITQTPDGDVWLATANGVKRIRGEVLTRYTTDQGLPSEFAKCLYQDAQHVLWVCTDGGLARWYPELSRFKAVTARDGLFDDTVLRVLEDREGYFWFTSNRGIARVARAELEAFFRGELRHVSARSFGESDGLRVVECNGTSSSSGLLSRDGRLWFPTIAGVAVIDPRRTVLNAVVPMVHVEEVQVDRQPVELAQARELAAKTRDLVFRYTATSFVDPSRVSFKYQLEGFDQGWVEAGTRREAYYTNLPPGDYRFRVIAANNDGVWNDAGASHAFRRLPHLYETTGFRLLGAALVLAALALAYSVRVRYLKRRERELLGHNEELAQALGAAREAVKLKSEFVANISHELRTPLNAIINLPAGILELFEREGRAACKRCSAEFALEVGERVTATTPCPECKEPGALVPTEAWRLTGETELIVRHLGTLERSGRHLLAVINDVLDFSKMEAGKFTLHTRELGVRALFDELTETFRPMIASRGVALELGEVKPDLMVKADPVKASQILINLVGNAMKFSEAGGKVELAARVEGASCVISVRDHGPGIAPEHQQLIFESFRQVDGSQTRRFGGTGLGLSITRRLVELHGGQIWVESTLGDGATFFVRLPLAGNVEAHVELPEVPAEEPGKPVVLVLDDEPVALETLRLTLEPLDVRVVTLLDPRRLIATVHEEKPSLLILDIMMPRVSGLTLLRELRADARTQALPVLVTSAYGANRELAESFQATWLSKPWERSQLLEVVKRLMEPLPPRGFTPAVQRSPRA